MSDPPSGSSLDGTNPGIVTHCSPLPGSAMPFLCRLLVGSMHHVPGHFPPGFDLRRRGLKFAERGVKNVKNKAFVGVAKMFAVLLKAAEARRNL